MLPDVIEDDSSRRHVDPHGKSLSGKEKLDPTLLKKQLHNLFKDWQNAGMVNADATFQQFGQVKHLGKLSVVSL